MTYAQCSTIYLSQSRQISISISLTKDTLSLTKDTLANIPLLTKFQNISGSTVVLKSPFLFAYDLPFETDRFGATNYTYVIYEYKENEWHRLSNNLFNDIQYIYPLPKDTVVNLDPFEEYNIETDCFAFMHFSKPGKYKIQQVFGITIDNKTYISFRSNFIEFILVD